MTYGEPLRLPGQLLVPDEQPTLAMENPADFVVRLRRKMAEVQPTPASRHGNKRPFVFKELPGATHIFLHDDTVRRPLQPPYTGPFKVLKYATDGKTLNIDLKGKDITVSVDRVKPAFVEQFAFPSARTPGPAPAGPEPPSLLSPTVENIPPISAPNPVVTRSGRRVRFKTRLDL
ncbi:uncharacterized protein LOC111003287 [Pieris rapae]|uniref:uncharacterized protein LOC111003287 n=1 Tax=Pieris rapae TaxID=64459 RepID=UPI001E28157D|nr:uncharacterized protein LOC111003287 [Pieris rapae]